MEPGRPQAGRRRQSDEWVHTLVIRGISAQARSQGGAYGNFVRRAPKGPLLALARAARWRCTPCCPSRCASWAQALGCAEALLRR